MSRNKREGYYRGLRYMYDLSKDKMVRKHFRDKDKHYALSRPLSVW